MSAELEKIVGMLSGANAELQCAAAMVIGELAPKDASVKKGLLAALKSDNELVRLYSVEALGRIDAREAAPHIIPLLSGSPRLRGRIQQILVGLGDEIIPLLQKQIEKAEPSLRSGILEVLGQFKSVDLSDTLFDALLDKDPAVARQAGAALKARFEGMQGDDRDKAARKIADVLDSPKAQKSAATLVSCVQILQSLKSPASIKSYLKLVDSSTDIAVRAQALAALAGSDFSKEEDRVVGKLLPLLAEEDQANVVSPALQVLGKAKVGKDHADRIFKLLKSPHPAIRLFAIRALGSIGGARAASGLIEGLWNSDQRVAEEASAALRSNAAFSKALIDALQEEEDVNRAMKLAGILKAYRDGIDASSSAGFLRKMLALFEKKNPAFNVYLEILRSAAPVPLRESVLKRGRELLNKKKYPEAVGMLKLLEREDIATGPSDYLLAVALLKVLHKDLATARFDRSPGVFLFSKLIRRGDFPLLKNLEKDAKVVGAADLLYLGFVLIERQGVERDLGGDVLKLLTRKFGSSKEGLTAKAKLKTQGV